MFDFSEKNYIISGSSKGIGKEIALGFLESGARILVNSRNSEDLKEIQKNNPDKVLVHDGDLTNEEEAKKLVEFSLKKWGTIDGIVCNIGSGRSVPPSTESMDELKRVFDLNLFTATNLIHYSLDALEKTSGTIVCISSICGHEALGAPSTYSAAKAALNSYVKSIARPLGGRNIRINVVSPGNIYFEGSVWEKKMADEKEKTLEMLESQVPLKRFGTPEEISNAVMFLSSNYSSFCTGTILVADGGQTRS